MNRARMAVVRLRIAEAKRRAQGEVSGHAGRYSGGGINYAGGLASEGYSGGYWQALADVELLLGGTLPNTRNYWPDALPESSNAPRRRARSAKGEV